MKDQPLISAIITTYKRSPEMLKRAVDSVLNQTYGNFELIVVDDSPADFPERDNVKKMLIGRDKVTYIQHEKNSGANVARNTGLRHAKGDYVAFLDDDDEWLPRKLELQISKMTDDAVGLVYGNHYRIDTTRNTERALVMPAHSGYAFDELIWENYIGSTSFPLLRKACFDDCGLFDTEMKSCQDYDMWLRIASKYKVEYVDEFLVKYFVHGGERISGDENKRIQGRNRIIEKHIAYLKQHPRTFGRRKMVVSINYILNRQYLKGLRVWLSGVALCPGNIKENLTFFLKDMKWLFITLFTKKRKESI